MPTYFLTTFLLLQIILLFFMTFHDWIHTPPLTNIRELEKYTSKKGRLINSALFALLIIIPLLLTWIFQKDFPLWVRITLAALYGTLTIGTVASWWIPYFFGSSELSQLKAFVKNWFIYALNQHF